MRIRPILLPILGLFCGHAIALTLPSNSAMGLPAILISRPGFSSNITTNHENPWPNLNTLVSVEHSEKDVSMKFTAYGPLLPKELSQSTITMLEEIWMRLGYYHRQRRVGEPPETLVAGNVTMHIVAPESEDWWFGSYSVADIINALYPYIRSNGPRDVYAVVGPPVERTGSFEARAALRLIINL